MMMLIYDNSCDAWYIFDGVISVLGRAALIGMSTYGLNVHLASNHRD